MNGCFGMHLENIHRRGYKKSKGCGNLIDQGKIILMTKMAIYEKRYIKEDRRRSGYYPEDYVYLKNFRTRFSVTLAVLIFVALHMTKMINQNLVIPTSVEVFINYYLKPYLVPWMMLMVGYTILSTAVYQSRYALSQTRLKGYNKLLKALDNYEQDKVDEERTIYETK